MNKITHLHPVEVHKYLMPDRSLNNPNSQLVPIYSGQFLGWGIDSQQDFPSYSVALILKSDGFVDMICPALVKFLEVETE